VATIYNALVNVPAGISAIHHEAIRALIQPYLETNPRMAGMIAEITSRSHAAYEQVLQTGEKELQRIVHLMSIN
jgi:thymidylate synthase ThyX